MRTIAVEEHFRSEAFRKLQEAGGFGPPRRESPRLQRASNALYDVGAGRLRELDLNGVDLQVLSHSPPTSEALKGEDAVTFARAINDELAAIIRTHPDRYAGFAMLPTTEPEAAAQELRRSVTDLGLRGAMIHGQTQNRFLDDPVFEPILAEAERQQVPIYLHPSLPSQVIRDAYFGGFEPEISISLAGSAWGWHVETGLHTLRLVLAGVFDHHPRLQIIIGHMGEAIPFMLARTDSVLKHLTHLERPLPDYFRQNVHYTTGGFFTAEPLACLLSVIGVDRIMFAIDHPFSDNAAGVEFLKSAALSETDREKIAHANAEALLGL